MKNSLLAAALLVTLVSTSAFAGNLDKFKGAFGITYVGVSVVIAVYGTSGLPVGLAVAGTSAIITTQELIRAHREQAAKAFLNDAQEYNQSGNASLNLQISINALRAENTELSEAEAVELLTDVSLELLK